jgi:hypothetical protein
MKNKNIKKNSKKNLLWLEKFDKVNIKPIIRSLSKK